MKKHLRFYAALTAAALLCLCLAACGKAPQEKIAGKRLSILGDSISTFGNVSNDATILPALADNPTFFPQYDIVAVGDTWWQQSIDALSLSLLVNNSYSGGWVTADMAGLGGTSGIGRCTSLGAGSAVPEIIAVYLGTNDCRFGVPAGSADAVDAAALHTAAANNDPVAAPADFATGYATMLARTRAAYPDAAVYCCTLSAATGDGCTPETLAAYNAVIRALAEKFNCNVVDFAAESGITTETITTYTADGLHPNKAGMQALSAVFTKALTGGAAA